MNWKLKEMENRLCQDCRYGKIERDENGKAKYNVPCDICLKGQDRWEPKEMENMLPEELKEPDYKFNQEIIDALREGKFVWYKHVSECWIKIDLFCSFSSLDSMLQGQWSLTKPKVKKKIERYVNTQLYKDIMGLNPIVKSCSDRSESYPHKITIEREEEE